MNKEVDTARLKLDGKVMGKKKSDQRILNQLTDDDIQMFLSFERKEAH